MDRERLQGNSFWILAKKDKRQPTSMVGVLFEDRVRGLDTLFVLLELVLSLAMSVTA